MLLSATAACARGPRVQILAPDGTSRVTVRVEVAEDPETRNLGLMYRPHLDEYAGMLFVFPQPSKQTFWMKNTQIPLDMIFADPAGKVLGIVRNAVPYSQDYLSVDAPSQYVLEVNAGFCKSHGIKAGDRLEFYDFRPNPID